VVEVIVERPAALDVHKAQVTACVRLADANGSRRSEVVEFSTMVGGLLTLRDWLKAHGVRQVAMEATGVYWKPVWPIVSDGALKLLLANAAHVKNVPGRKTDVSDAAWLADLLAHGLIRGSFVPDEPTQQLRELLRTRKQLVRERSGHVQRLQKTLEDANIKLDSVVTDILGLSGRRMVEALIAGQTEPRDLALLAHRRLHATSDTLEAALRGRVKGHHRFLLQLHLNQIDGLAGAIASIDQVVEALLEPFRAAIELIRTIPGLGVLSAEVVVSEIGVDMSRFETAGHLISWAGLCPKNDQSAGKRRSTRMKKGAPWLKTTLVQCAWAASLTKGSYLQAQYLRLRSRRGAKKALCAVAASMLTAAYHMLKLGQPYHDLGAEHFDQRNRGKHVQRLLNRLQTLGFAVTVTPLAT
jgi:transposase